MAHIDLHDEARPVHLPQEGYDRTEPRLAWIWGFAIGSLVLIGVLLLGVHVLYEWFKAIDYERQIAQPVAEDMIRIREREDADLNQDGYADPKTGAVRLSIGRAMDLLIKEYAEGRAPFPTSPTPVKPPEPPAGAPAAAPAPGTPNAAPGTPAPAQEAQPAKPAAH